MSTDNIQPTLARHPRYYGSEHLTFAVDGYLFQLPFRRLKQSTYFQDMLGSEHLGGSIEGRSDEHPIVLQGISSFEMESFVDVLDAWAFDKEVEREWKQLATALHLATMWEFEDVRARLIKDMSELISDGGIAPLDRIEVSIQCRVDDWLYTAYQELCERTEAVTTEEATRLGMNRLAAIYRVRDRRHSSKTFSGHCNRCGRGDYVVCTSKVSTKIATLDLIKAEDVLSSTEGPLSCTSA